MTGKPRLAAPLAVALIAASFAAASADAEDNGGIGGFFSHLFGAPPSPTPSPKAADAPSPRPSAAAHKPRKKPHEPPSTREASAPAAPAAPSTPSPQASEFVYVLGDSLAISAADGMDEDLEDKPEIGVVDRARDASGLVRDDYFDWAKAARELVGGNEPPPKDKEAKGKPAPAAAEAKPKVDYVVVMLGINDMQQVRDGKDYVDPLTDRWKAVYSQRIQAVVAPLRAAHIPVVWVGLPPMRSEKFNAQVVALNQVFKDNAEKAGATFVDIFDDFADQGGQFDAFGPNIEGQKVRLRGPDGIHLTAAGGKKLAHFLDAEILKVLDKQEPPNTDIAALPPDLSRTTDDVNEQIRREMGQPALLAPGPAPGPKQAPIAEAAPEPPKPVVKPEAGPIASLATRPLSPGATLASVVNTASGEAERILRLGEPPRAAPGRADDFSR